LPIGLGYLSVSFAFGVQASLLGIPAIISILISMTNLTSAGQLAGITVIAAFGSLLEIALTQLVINSRYFLMSITLSQKLDQSFTSGKRFLCSLFITDEIFAIGASKSKLNVWYILGLATLPHVGWVLGTVLGAVASNLLPSIVSNSLGIALYAMFIAIIIPPSIGKKGVLITVILAASISCALFFIPTINTIPQGFKIIISALLTASIMAAVLPLKESGSNVS
jgi:predicted branched-subunit amino acid permease